MNDLGLGKLLTQVGHVQRDAVHIAVVPVVAHIRLDPGEHVGLVHGTVDHVCPTQENIGIVDPFLKAKVTKDQRCWLFLYPGSITSLRHDWTHPAFSAQCAPAKDVSKAENWLRAFAAENSIDYSQLIDGAVSGQGACFGDDDGPDNIDQEFWQNIEIVAGKQMSADHRESTYFRCSC